MNFTDGKVTAAERIKSFKMPKEAGGWVAYLKEAPPKPEKKEESKDKKKNYGTQLVLHSLKDGNERVIEDVLSYYFTKDGQNIFYVASSKKKPESDGLYRLIPGRDTPVPLLHGKGNYKKFAMNKHETMRAFLTDRDDQKTDEPTFNLYGCKSGDKQAALWVSHAVSRKRHICSITTVRNTACASRSTRCTGQRSCKSFLTTI